MIPNSTELARCRDAELLGCDIGELVDLCGLRTDAALPIRERMEAFVRQVRNPYLFQVDGLIVKTVYLPDANTRFCDAVSALLAP